MQNFIILMGLEELYGGCRSSARMKEKIRECTQILVFYVNFPFYLNNHVGLAIGGLAIWLELPTI